MGTFYILMFIILKSTKSGTFQDIFFIFVFYNNVL